MMKDGDEIKVCLLSEPPRAWLSLQGTILKFRRKYWSRESTVYIPIELVSIAEKNRLDGYWLIAALLSLFILPSLGGAIGTLWVYFGNRPAGDSSIFVGIAIFAALFMFLGLLIRFFIPEKTVAIDVASSGMTIDFWVDKKHEADIKELFAAVEFRKSGVAELMSDPMHFAVCDATRKPWKSTFVLMILFIFPALITEIPWLLLAGLIPLILRILPVLAGAKTPPEFRRATRHYRKREWSQARDLLQDLIRLHPDYLPARRHLIELKMRLGDFDGADASLAEIQDSLDARTSQSIQNDIMIMRKIAKRSLESVQQDG